MLVSGVSGSRAGEDGDTTKFLTERFPNCLINEFSFLGGGLCHQGATFIQQVQLATRTTAELTELSELLTSKSNELQGGGYADNL